MKRRYTLVVLLFSLTMPLHGRAGDSPTANPGVIPKGEQCYLDDLGIENFQEDHIRELMGQIPHDAYDSTSSAGVKLQAAKKDGCRADQIKVQRIYDVFSWQSFLAVNWPMDPASGGATLQPAQHFTDKGAPQWATWMEARNVFKEDGSEPDGWNAGKVMAERVLSEINQPSPTNHSLWDQNGMPVYYEMLMNEVEYEFIKTNSLYNQEGQTKYLSSAGQVIFAPGSIPTQKRPDGPIGPIELKLAWKVLGESDIKERFFKMKAKIPGRPKEVDVGLVGMHIAHKTVSSSRWVWSTFEHVDNVRVDDLQVLEYSKKGQRLKPSFYDPDCPTCPVNTLPPPIATKRRTQVIRVSPISSATADLNHQAQELLRKMGSEWQYYELVGTQYVSDANKQPTSENSGDESITNHSGGAPRPAFLVNTVLETYAQKGNQDSNFVRPDGVVHVFETSSCMSCHYDAGLLSIVNGRAVNIPGTADFSWLLSKAKPQKSKTQVLYRHSPISD